MVACGPKNHLWTGTIGGIDVSVVDFIVLVEVVRLPQLMAGITLAVHYCRNIDSTTGATGAVALASRRVNGH